MNVVVLSFLTFLLGFVAIGAWSAYKRKTTTDDYLLASRSMGPWFAGLSAVATNNSGFMFIGLIGSIYTMGLSGIWVIIGFIVGDWMMWLWVPQRLRRISEAKDSRTIPAVLARGDTESTPIRKLAAVAIILFLGTYSAAQLGAGSKALQVLLGWEPVLGAIIGAAVVLLYCFAGGIRASIWTDVAQSVVMFVSMLLLALVAVSHVGGFAGLWDKLNALDPTLTNLFPTNLRFGLAMYLLGWLGAGLGAVGQPHVMIRWMVVRDTADITAARRVYFGFYWTFTAGAIITALCARVILPESATFDPELALPSLSLELLPAILTGLVFAGLFASTISTADSQVLSCSAAITQDLFPRWQDSYSMAKAGTVIVTALVLAIALSASESVFSLVVLSWAALSAIVGPLMIVRVLGWPVGSLTGVLMMLAGIAALLFWRNGLAWSDGFYEALPGMAAGLAVYGISRLMDREATRQ